jgi:predicted nucleic acid-binding protein
MTKDVIVNNTVLSNLASVDRLDILKKVFLKVYTTLEVKDEVENGIRCNHLFQSRTKQIIDTGQWIFIANCNQQEFKIFNDLRKRIDLGEASCLAIAKERGWIFLTDDDKARRIAKQLGVRLSGTIGVLVTAIEDKIISKSEAEKIHQDMMDNGYHSPISSLSEIV